MTDSKFKIGPQLIDPNFVTKVDLNSVYDKIDQKYKNPRCFIFGDNTNGALGLGDITHRSSPVQVGSLTNWKYISGYTNNKWGIKTDGTLWAWGDNSQGQLGLGNVTHRSSPVQVGSLTNWKYISNSSNTAVAIKTDGTLWAWGDNINGELGLGNTLARSSPVQVGNLTNWKLVNSGTNHTAAIKTDGTLWAWGGGADGKLGLGDITSRSSPVQVGNLTDWKYISVGVGSTYAVKTDGTLWTWGDNNPEGSLGLGDITSRSSPVQVGSLTNWKYVIGIGNTPTNTGAAVAVKTDGTLWVWGSPYNGQLGLGETSIVRSSPVQVGDLTNWKEIVKIDTNSVAAIKTDGTLWSWGLNTEGQLGLGDIVNRSSPTQVGVSSWKTIYIQDGLEE